MAEPNNTSERDRHLSSPGPKRILAIDGGGARGAISLRFLARIESLLRTRMQNPTLRLCDYFDLIGGTSTGAIIATALALGMSTDELIEIYRSLSKTGFQKSSWMSLGGYVSPKFKTGPLSAAIERQVGSEVLGSPRLRTGLAIIAKRLDTESIWVFHNNPNGRFFSDRGHDGKGIPNKDMKLTNLIRASTAAPRYFSPEFIEVARDDTTGKVVRGAFVDGGVSPHNNPSLLLFMLATLSGYGFRWKTGPDDLLLVSVGNGAAGDVPAHDRMTRIPAAWLGVVSLLSLMKDCSVLNQTLLQWFSRCPTPWTIDSEIDDLGTDRIGDQLLLHYLRYDAVLEAHWLKEMGIMFSAVELTRIRQFDLPELVPTWLEIGRRAADKQITDDHFPRCFDLS